MKFFRMPREESPRMNLWMLRYSIAEQRYYKRRYRSIIYSRSIIKEKFFFSICPTKIITTIRKVARSKSPHNSSISLMHHYVHHYLVSKYVVCSFYQFQKFIIVLYIHSSYSSDPKTINSVSFFVNLNTVQVNGRTWR